MNLLDECITALSSSKDKCEVLSELAKNSILKNFFDLYPYRVGRIDWPNLKNKIIVNDFSQIVPLLELNKKTIHEPVYIIWDMTTLPIIKCNLVDVLKYLDDVTAVSFDTWIYCPSAGWVIEFYHEGEVTLGFTNKGIN